MNLSDQIYGGCGIKSQCYYIVFTYIFAISKTRANHMSSVTRRLNFSVGLFFTILTLIIFYEYFII